MLRMAVLAYNSRSGHVPGVLYNTFSVHVTACVDDGLTDQPPPRHYTSTRTGTLAASNLSFCVEIMSKK